MFETKKSQTVISIFFAVCLLLIPIYSAAQNLKNKRDDNRRIVVQKTGTISLKPEKRINSITASDNEKQLFVTDQNGTIYSFDTETLVQIWASELGGKISSNVIAFEKKLFLITSGIEEDGSKISYLWTLDKDSGITIDRELLKVEGAFQLFKGSEFLYAVNESATNIFELRSESSAQVYAYDQKVTFPPIFESVTENFYFVDDSEIVRFSFQDGKFSAEKIDLKIERNSKISIFKKLANAYLIGDYAGNLYLYDKSGKSNLWKFRAGARISDVELFGEKIIVSSYDNFLYCLDASDGERIWKKRLPGRITKIKKSDEASFYAKSSYSEDFYLFDAETGNVSAQITNLNKTVDKNHDLTLTPRLIITQNSNSIDIYKVN